MNALLRTTFRLLILCLLILMAPSASWADDRDLIRSAGDDPYIFVLLDTSGSMTGKISGAGTAWGADDPSSKAYQAKAAIYDVVKDLGEGTRIGFATFSQQNGRAITKRWQYKADLTQAEAEALPWWNEIPFPDPDRAIEFGDTSSTVGSCPSGVGINNLYTREKLGLNGNATTVIFANWLGATFKVSFHSTGSPIGPPMDLKITVERCGSGVTREAIISMVPFYTEDLDGTPIQTAEFISSFTSNNPCTRGWRANDEGGELSHTTFADPLMRGPAFDRGNVLPWDWVTHNAPGFELRNRDEFLRRLAPNIYQNGAIDPDAIPDFRLGPYFQDKKNGSSHRVRTEYADNAPFGFNNLTPLDGMLTSLEEWYTEWEPYANPKGGKGSVPDPGFECRPRFAILLTDGRETCNGNPPEAAGSLLAAGIRTFVIGYGTGVTGNDLQGIADKGGTGKEDTIVDQYVQDCQSFNYKTTDPVTGQPVEKNICPGPVIAETTETLKEVLRAIFDTLSKSQTSFAGASVPSGQVEAADVLLLPSFLPISDQSTWKGSLAMFKRPLPLTDGPTGGKIPDRDEICQDNPLTGEEPSACLAWDAGNAMLGKERDQDPISLPQAPTFEQIAMDGEYKMGEGYDERRVFWTRPAQGLQTPLRRAYLEPTQDEQLDGQTDTLLARYDLWNALGVEHDIADPGDDDEANLETEGILADVLSIREGTDGENIGHSYILGDIFHSRPTYVGAPARYEYMVANLYGDGDCWDGDTFDFDNQGYRCFWLRNKWRRQVAFAGSNDAQLHAFDAGRVRHTDSQGRFRPHFSVGIGREVFSFVPQAMLETLETRGPLPLHQWGVDGDVTVDDAFVVPIWNGISQIDNDDRQWRTLLIGSLRRGGRGYYALDITTPDPVQMDSEHKEMIPPTEAIQSYVPGCLEVIAGCGPLPYPSVRWEFLDLDGNGLPADADNNGADDMGPGWSTPVTGRIKIKVGTEVLDKFVAVFGGGIDPLNEDVGNFLYILDLETGRPLYKRDVEGAVPSQVAAVDTDRNGYLDRVYFGDRDGHIYKLAIDQPGDVTVDPVTGLPTVVPSQWKPLEIFDTGGREIFFPPSVIWSAARREYALAFGTGDREDLWSPPAGSSEGFFVFMDRGFDESNTTSPYTDSDLVLIERDSAPSVLGDLLLQSPPTTNLPGYWIRFAESERLVSKPFAVAGFTVFSTFEPSSLTADGLCVNNGVSNLYTIQTTSGNALISGKARYRTIEGFASSPFSEVSASPGSGDGNGADDVDNEPPEELGAITELLKSQMPRTCRFTNQRIDIKAIRSDTGIEWLAPIPVCVQQKNWKEWRGTR